MAENLDFQTIRTGGRVVDCSGLENPLPDSPETAEMADFCGVEPAQDAPFTGCSAARDGNNVGTSLERLRRIISRRIPTPEAKLTQKNRGWVYFVQAAEGGPIKIGTALDVPRRLKKLQQAQSAELVVLATRKGGPKTERSYHCRFAEHRIRGEWFHPAPAILETARKFKERES